MERAARISDKHTCPLSEGAKPHIGGPVTTGESTVEICGQHAARVDDKASCIGSLDAIATGCPSVWINNRPAARRLDQTRHQGVIVTGCRNVFIGDPATDAWLGGMLAILCPRDKATLDKLRAGGVKVTAFDRIYFEDPYYDGTKWTTKIFEAGGSAAGKEINMITGQGPIDNASTLYHEGVHTTQPDSMPWRDKEYQAYIAEEQWRIDRGFPPGRPDFRTKDAAGKTIVNEAAVHTFVHSEYPGISAGDQIIGRMPSGDTVLERPDGSQYSRPPKKGDSYPGPQRTDPPGGRPVHSSQLRCP